MVKQIKISNFTEVKNIMNAATHCVDEIGVHDGKGSIADAKSILGLMSLDYPINSERKWLSVLMQ